ncbi:MAG: segregation/condensation protein A [Clostridia bacterium]|nr:segregation/condensation protein A [Clostridia bacterium]
MDDLQQSIIENDYRFVLENFEGPIEMLYNLIKESKMSIDEIRLGDLTSQYIEHMKKLPELDIESASGFIQMMAILLEIKTKMLLPRDDEDEGAPEEDLEYLAKLMIKEYEIIKDASFELEALDSVDRFYKEPDKSAGDYRFVLGDMTLESMLDAFAKMLVKLNEKDREQIVQKQIAKDRWTVAEKIDNIKDVVTNKKKVKFSQFFEDDFTRSEVITVFLALLELLKRHIVKINQDNTFDDIDIYFNEESAKENLKEESMPVDEYK